MGGILAGRKGMGAEAAFCGRVHFDVNLGGLKRNTHAIAFVRIAHGKAAAKRRFGNA
jgi:hypothetical protein